MTKPMIGEELREALGDLRNRDRLFHGLWLREATQRQIASSLMAGRHLLLLGPPGSGKTRLTRNLATLLPPLVVVRGCPANCLGDGTPCPWCAIPPTGTQETQEKVERAGWERMVCVVGNGSLHWEDLLGDLDPHLGIRLGTNDIRSFIPGKLLRANRGILLLDQVEAIPQKTLNVLLQVLDEGVVRLGLREEPLSLDLLIIGTGSPHALERLSVNLSDHFDLVRMNYPRTLAERWELLRQSVRAPKESEPQSVRSARASEHQRDNNHPSLPHPYTPIASYAHDANDTHTSPPFPPFSHRVLELADRIERHPEVERGVSPRGTLRCLELLEAFPQVEGHNVPDFEDFCQAALLSFPHRLRLKGTFLAQTNPVELVRNLIFQLFAEVENEKPDRWPAKLSQLALELAQNRDLSHPLRWGHRGLLLRRIKNQPQSQLAQIYLEIREDLRERWSRGEPSEDRGERFLHEMEWLDELETADNQERRLEEEAIRGTLELLEKLKLLRKDGEGWAFHRQGIRRLLEELLPPELGRWKALSSLAGRHRQPAPSLLLPKERLSEVRKYHRGDRYRDLALRATLREAIRRKRDTIQPSDLRVYQRGQASRLDIVLTLDLSGTMRQGEKLWHAKEAIGALAGACSLSRDRVGLVTFSNLAHRVLDPVDDPVLVMEKLVDLWIRRNAFTNISHGLKTARDSCLECRLPTTVPHIILISDGQATAPPSGPRESALREAATTHRHEITISCICLLQGSSDVELMRRISRIGRGRLYLVEDVRSLPQVMLEEHGSVRASGA